MKIKLHFKVNPVFPDSGSGAENFCQIMHRVGISFLEENLELCDKADKQSKEQIELNRKKVDELTLLMREAKCIQKGKLLYFSFHVKDISVIFPRKTKKEVVSFFKTMKQLQENNHQRKPSRTDAMNDYLDSTRKYYEQVISDAISTLQVEKKV